MPTDKPRVTVTFDPDEYEAILRYQKDNSMRSFSSAVNELLSVGFSKQGIKTATISKEAEIVARKYDSLPDHSKELIQIILKHELGNTEEQEKGAS